MKNDLAFGVTLLGMDPVDAALAMQERYGISLEGLSEGDDSGLLERLNGIE